METKKIAIACFVGAVIGTAVALSVTPMFWWLGMLAGFGAGYLCYDLKEIREKAPIAWEKTKKGSRCSLDWLKEPHPFLCLWLILTVIIVVFLVIIFSFENKTDLIISLIISSLASIMMSGAMMGLLTEFARKGVHKKRCFWKSCEVFSKREKREMLANNYTEIPVTYRSIYGLMLVGLSEELRRMSAVIALATLKTLKRIGKGLLMVPYFVFYGMWVLMAKFLWHLFKLIHSQKRVLCGFDSAIGVTITYFLLGAKATTPGQQAMIVICGGIIGAVVGVLNFEIISKRLLHLVPVKNDA